MASVTDGSLLSAAHDIVSDFMDKKASLNDGVMKKASELGLNSDQTQRLIERTNTEAFLRVYPSSTDFEVASPEVILGIKTASITPNKVVPIAEDDGLFKAASVEKKASAPRVSFGIATGASDAYQAKLDAVTGEDIFGMDDEFYKTAAETQYDYALDVESREMCRAICDMNKTASQIAQEELDREMRFNDAIEDLGEFIKQASMSGMQSIEESEYELRNMFPQERGAIAGVYDAVVTKMASDGVHPMLLKRAGADRPIKLAHTSELTNKFQRVLDIVRG